MNEVTQLLHQVKDADRNALDRLLPLVYDELRQLAAWQLRQEHGPRTLLATALVHEAYSKMVSGGAIDAEDRSHFLGIAARAMRQILVDQARTRKASKQGGDRVTTTLGDGDAAIDFDAAEMIALDDALEKLDARQRQVVEYRFFAGMDEKEIAAILGVTDRTVRRDWVKARAWLYRALYPEQRSGESG